MCSTGQPDKQRPQLELGGVVEVKRCLIAAANRYFEPGLTCGSKSMKEPLKAPNSPLAVLFVQKDNRGNNLYVL